MGCPQSRLADAEGVRRDDVVPARPAARRRDDRDDGVKRVGAPADARGGLAPTSDAKGADRPKPAGPKKKRAAIAVEALAADVPVVPKDAATTALIVRAVRPNPLFAGLPESVTLALVASMSRVFVPAGENIITQGDVEGANRFFVLESGSAVVRVAPERTQGAAPRDDVVRAAAAESENETPPSRDDATKRPSSRTLSSDSDPDPSGELVGSCRAGDAFGELALLYTRPRAATIRASFDCSLWALERSHYLAVKRRHQESLRERKRALVSGVPLFARLGAEDKSKIADALEPRAFERGDAIVRKGERGDELFVCATGELEVVDPDPDPDPDPGGGSGSRSWDSSAGDGHSREKKKTLARLSPGDAFGERALVSESGSDARAADVVVRSARAECFVLNKSTFDAVVGSYESAIRGVMLRRIPALAAVPDETLYALAERVCVAETFAPGQRVFERGDPGEKLIVVESGEAELIGFETEASHSSSPGGKKETEKEETRRTTTLLPPGSWFGERALAGAERRAFRASNASSVHPLRVFSLRRSDLERALGDGLRSVATRARLELLGKVAVLRALPPATREALAGSLEPTHYDAGRTVFERGDEGDAVYIVESGAVRITDAGGDALATVVGGEYFGELALLRKGGRRAATATAHGDAGAFVLALGRAQFERSEFEFRAFAEALETAAKSKYGDEAAVFEDDDDSAGDSGEGGGASSPPPVASNASAKAALRALRSLDDFTLHAVLGLGAFGKVYLASPKRWPADASPSVAPALAVKTLSKGQILHANLQRHVMRERDAMRACDSPFLVRLCATFQDRASLYMCMETVMGGELFTRLGRVGGRVSERDASFYFACVVCAFEYMQGRHLVYRDLKPENVLIDHLGYAKIADFGFVKRVLPGERTYTLCGTPEYMAPELFKQSGHGRGVDWWALGVLAYEMVCGAPPFYDPDGDGAKQMRRVLKGAYDFPPGLSDAFRDVVRRLLHPDETRRLGCGRRGVEDVRDHAWVRGSRGSRTGGGNEVRTLEDGGGGVDWDAVRARRARAPWTPRLSSARDFACFDEYEMDAPHPGEAFDGDVRGAEEDRRGGGFFGGGVLRRKKKIPGEEVFEGF